MTLFESILGSAPWAAVLLVQVTLVSLLGWLAWWAARRGGPALRGAILLTALVGLLVVPWLAVVTPVWLPLPEWISSMGAEPEENDLGQAIALRLTPARAPSETKAIAVFVPQPAGQADGQTVGLEQASPKQKEEAGQPLSKAEAYVFNLSLATDDAASSAPLSTGERMPRRSPSSWSLVSLLAGVWLLGAFVSLSHALCRLARLHRWARQARPISEPEWTSCMASLAARQGLQAVPLRESHAIASALTLGLIRPMILLPRCRRTWSAKQRTLILTHELAHVRRRDYLAGLVVELALCLCWFHPLVRWLAGRLRLEQEYAADAWAAATTDSRDYIRCLARLALELGQGRHSLAPAFWRRRPEILRRIDMLQRNPKGVPPRLGRRAACIVAMLAAACLAVAGIGPLQSAADEPRTADSAPKPDVRSSADSHGDPLPAGVLARLGTTRLRHDGEITFVAFGSEGKSLLTAGQDETIRLWDLATGKEIRRYTRPKLAEIKKEAKPGPDEKVMVEEALIQIMGGGRRGSNVPVAVSPDGKTVAARNGNSIQLWEIETGKPLRQIEAPKGGLTGLLFSPDSRILASRTTNGGLSLWEADTGKELRQIKPPQRPKRDGIALTFGGDEADAPGMAFTPDSKALAAAAIAYKGEETINSLKLWDVTSGEETWQIKPPQNAGVSAVAIAPDGKLLAYGSNNVVHLCEANTGKEVRQLKLPNGGIRSLIFSPDGQTLAVRGRNHRVRLFESQTGKELHQLDSAENPQSFGGLAIFGDAIFAPETRALAFSPDGKQVASASGSTIRLWEAATGKEVPLLGGHRKAPTAILVAPDGKTVVSWGGDRVIQRWDAATGKVQGQFAAPTGTTLAAFSPDGRIIALANRDNTFRIHDTATGKELHKLKGHQGGVAALGFAPDGKVLASRGTNDNSIRLYDPAGGVELRQITMRPVRNPEGGTVFVIGGPARSPRGPGLAFSPDGRLLVVPGPGSGNSSHTLTFLDAATGKELRKIESAQPFTSVAFSPDGRTLATEKADRTITLWEAASGKQRAKLGTPVGEQPQDGRSMMAFSIAIDGLGGGVATDPAGPIGLTYSPDGRALVVRGADSAIRVWDVTVGKEISQLKGHAGRIETVAFAADGKTLASGATDTTILLWDAAAPMRELSKPTITELPTEEVETVWRDLAGEDAGKALRGVQKLATAPSQAVPFLADHLKPAARIDPEKINRWIADLESNLFAVRQEANTNLIKSGELAVPALRKVLASSPPLETRKRIEELLDRLTGGALSSDQLRFVRAIEALERIATPEARNLLRTLAEGAPGAMPTRESQAALDRLN
jgi:WD40 repeat protein/beta-lactamase regulating signal transducer with metallopeptidase domain